MQTPHCSVQGYTGPALVSSLVSSHLGSPEKQLCNYKSEVVNHRQQKCILIFVCWGRGFVSVHRTITLAVLSRVPSEHPQVCVCVCVCVCLRLHVWAGGCSRGPRVPAGPHCSSISESIHISMFSAAGKYSSFLLSEQLSCLQIWIRRHRNLLWT